MNLKENTIETDVCIVGAGPSGASASLMLSKLKINHLIIDKATFPRDKTCGDGLILHVFRALKTIDPNLLNDFINHPKFISSNKGNFHVSDKTVIEIEEGNDNCHNPIFYGKRIDFDYFLVQQLNSPYIQKRFGVSVNKITNSNDGVLIELKDGTSIKSKLVIGADGFQSIVSKKLAKNQLDKKRTNTFISAYFENLSGLTNQNEAYIKMIYKKMPLFFYIFPLPNGQANVSLGGSINALKKYKINLNRTIEDIIAKHPKVAPKFKNAKQVSAWRGWGIPYNYGHLNISGDRFMLIGDAAGLANSFYKEGVGTGMMSGIISAQQAAKCITQNNFSGAFIQEYDKKIDAEFGKLLKYGKAALKLSSYRLPFRFLVKLVKSKIESKINKLIQKTTYN